MPTSAHARLIIEHLKNRGETIAIAESLTAGGVGHAITQIPGASSVFLGGVIAYTSEVKVKFLGVSQKTIDSHTVVSEEVANEMAAGVLEKFNATWAIATTGIAGPGDTWGFAKAPYGSPSRAPSLRHCIFNSIAGVKGCELGLYPAQ